MRSYRTFSPLLAKFIRKRYISVALVLGSPPAGVTRYPCPMEPGLSSPGAFRHPAAAVRPGRGIIVPYMGPLVKEFYYLLEKAAQKGYTKKKSVQIRRCGYE